MHAIFKKLFLFVILWNILENSQSRAPKHWLDDDLFGDSDDVARSDIGQRAPNREGRYARYPE